MKKYFVTYDQAVALKELGYDSFMREDCLAYFNTSNSNHDLETKDWWCLPKNDFQYALSAPLKSQVFEWFRKEHHMFSHIMTYEGNEIPRFKGEFAYFAEIDFLIAYEEIEKPFKSYEEAESACIDRLIEIVKNK